MERGSTPPSTVERLARKHPPARGSPGVIELLKVHIPAEGYGAEFNSIRGAYYSHTRSLGGSPKRSSSRSSAPVDPIESATSLLEKALEDIDAELDAAKQRADEATSEHKRLRETAGEARPQFAQAGPLRRGCLQARRRT
jgi:hypothetical protein